MSNTKQLVFNLGCYFVHVVAQSEDAASQQERLSDVEKQSVGDVADGQDLICY